MIKKIKNNDSIAHTWCGQEIQPGDYYTIQAVEEMNWANDSQLLVDIGNAVAIVNDGTSDITDINTAINYLKDSLPQEVKVSDRIEARTVNCKLGRKLHSRYMSFMTSSPTSLDNTDWNNTSFGDVTYKMYKWVNDVRVLTTDGAEADETWIDFEPTFNYEISGGAVSVPSTLAGENESEWEVHVIAVPDVPAQMGGSILFIANPRLKFNKNATISVDSSFNPAELLYNATYHTNKLRFIFMHPTGAQSEFQINLKLYK